MPLEIKLHCIDAKISYKKNSQPTFFFWKLNYIALTQQSPPRKTLPKPKIYQNILTTRFFSFLERGIPTDTSFKFATRGPKEVQILETQVLISILIISFHHLHCTLFFNIAQASLPVLT